MALSEIKVPSAKNNPINTFYVYSVDAKSITVDDVIIGQDLTVGRDLHVGRDVTIGDDLEVNQINSTAGTPLFLTAGQSGDYVEVAQPKFTGANIVPSGICYVKSDGGMVTVPQVALTCINTTSIPNGAFTNIDFKTNPTIYDTRSFKTSDQNFTVPTDCAGKYWITAMCRFADSALGPSRGISIRLNGGLVNPMGWFSTGAGTRASAMISFAITLAVGDVISVAAFQDSGGALDVGTAQLNLQLLQFA